MSSQVKPNPASLLLEQLRESTGESQWEFARRLGVHYKTYGAYERGDRWPTEDVRQGLLGEFREFESRIHSAFDETRLLRVSQTEKRGPAKTKEERARERVIQELLWSGRIAEAKAAIDDALNAPLTPRARLWLLDFAGGLRFDDDHAAAVVRWSEAIKVADGAEGLDDAAIDYRERLARRLQHHDDFAEAHAVVDAGIRRRHDASKLWRRKGLIHWYEHSYIGALGCLMAAREYGEPKKRIVHARGQVLAEMGDDYESAISDLTEAMQLIRWPGSRAYARSTRAYVLFKLGRHEEAFREFAAAEDVRPENGWLHYFRALCYAELGRTDELTAALTQALACETPRLNRPKREHAQALLDQHGQGGNVLGQG